MQHAPKSHFVAVAHSSQLAEGQRLAITYGPRSIVLMRIQSQVYAVDNVCPHRNGEMVFGALEGFHLYCPLHAWVFDVRTGQAFFPAGATLECFDVQEIDGTIALAARKKPV
jgi:nitrite reductase (NADH) small subunit